MGLGCFTQETKTRESSGMHDAEQRGDLVGGCSVPWRVHGDGRFLLRRRGLTPAYLEPHAKVFLVLSAALLIKRKTRRFPCGHGPRGWLRLSASFFSSPAPWQRRNVLPGNRPSTNSWMRSPQAHVPDSVSDQALACAARHRPGA